MSQKIVIILMTTMYTENCYECECGRTYKHRQNLHAHKKKCIYEEKKTGVNWRV